MWTLETTRLICWDLRLIILKKYVATPIFLCGFQQPLSGALVGTVPAEKKSTSRHGGSMTPDQLWKFRAFPNTSRLWHEPFRYSWRKTNGNDCTKMTHFFVIGDRWPLFARVADSDQLTPFCCGTKTWVKKRKRNFKSSS